MRSTSSSRSFLTLIQGSSTNGPQGHLSYQLLPLSDSALAAGSVQEGISPSGGGNHGLASSLPALPTLVPTGTHPLQSREPGFWGHACGNAQERAYGYG